MSLINQALHKAQRDRTPNRMPQPGEKPPSNYANSGSGMNPAIIIGLVVMVAVLIGLVAGLSVVIFKGDSPQAPPAAVAAAPQATAASPRAAPTVDKAEAKPEISAPIERAIETPPAVAAPAPSVVDELRKAREAAEAQAAAEAKAAKEAAARAEAKPSQDIIDWLGRAKVSGVKISEAGSKAIINGQAYSVGEYVNFKLGLKILIIQESRILFVDNNEKKYMKRL